MTTNDIFILSLFQHGYKVKYTTAYHLLRGKRTTAVLMYGFLNHLLPFFSLFPNYPESDFRQSVARLIKQELLAKKSKDLVQLTLQGQMQLKRETALPTDQLNGFLYGRIDETFLELLLFASQVVSEFSHGNQHYRPIEKNPAKQYQLKNWLKQLPPEKGGLGQHFFAEWHRLFLQLLPTDRDLFVNLLSGHQQVGQTVAQVFPDLATSELAIVLLKKNYCHLLLKRVSDTPHDYPYFFSLYDILADRRVNESAQQSYHLFLAGKGPMVIANQRGLKTSTVSEHLIEAAIVEEKFPHNRLFSQQTSVQLATFAKAEPNIREWRFADVVTRYPEITFLEFRGYQIKRIRGEEK